MCSRIEPRRLALLALAALAVTFLTLGGSATPALAQDVGLGPDAGNSPGAGPGGDSQAKRAPFPLEEPPAEGSADLWDTLRNLFRPPADPAVEELVTRIEKREGVDSGIPGDTTQPPVTPPITPVIVIETEDGSGTTEISYRGAGGDLIPGEGPPIRLPRLKGVLTSSDRDQVAILDDTFVRTGDFIAGFSVRRIRKTSVVLARQGKEYTLYVQR